MNTTLITIVPKRLSDGSKVYDVLIGRSDVDFHDRLRFEAVTEKDAQALVDKLHNALLDHTNEMPQIEWA